MGAVSTVAFVAETSYSEADHQVALDKLHVLYSTKTRFATAGEFQNYDTRPVTGANVHLEAVLDNYNGYRRLSRIEDVMTTFTQSIS